MAAKAGMMPLKRSSDATTPEESRSISFSEHDVDNLVDIKKDQPSSMAIEHPLVRAESAPAAMMVRSADPMSSHLTSHQDAVATTADSSDEDEEKKKEFIQHWEKEALKHFRNSDWEGKGDTLDIESLASITFILFFCHKFPLTRSNIPLCLLFFLINKPISEVVIACKKVLQVQKSQAYTTNFDILYEMGYAYMRLEKYELAVKFYRYAHKIDPNRIALRFAMGDLRRRVQSGGRGRR